MSIRPAPLLLPIVLLATWPSLGCENNGTDTDIGPGAVRASDANYVSRGVLLQPVVVAVAVPVVLCPLTPPFLAPVDVVVHGDSDADLSLRRVEMRFTDATGAAAGFTAFTGTDLTKRFGSTVVPALGTRRFPLSFGFGCTGLPAGTLNVGVFVVDSAGRETRSFHAVRVSAP